LAEVTMSLEEYEALIGMSIGERLNPHISNPKKDTTRKKRVGKKDPKMARALRKANQMGRKKSGGYKKGWSQGKIMKKAHQLRRKM
jgi:hypothetical protein